MDRPIREEAKRSLEEAIEEMHGSKLVRETLGEYAFEKYLISKKAEWED